MEKGHNRSRAKVQTRHLKIEAKTTLESARQFLSLPFGLAWLAVVLAIEAKAASDIRFHFSLSSM